MQDDTVKIDEVLVKAAEPSGKSGFVHKIISTGNMTEISLISLSDLLDENSSLYIKTYGAGAMASSSIRGMGANHTSVLWEGVDISSPMLSQTDLSSLPAFLFDNIALFKGAGGGDIMKPGPGGTISFSSKAHWDAPISFSYGQSIGSYRNIGEQIDMKYGNDKLRFSTSAYINTALNNYPYNNEFVINGSQEIRENADYKKMGFKQELYLRQQGEMLSVKLLYNICNQSLPGPVSALQIPDNENQYSESIRTIIDYRNYKSPIIMDLKLAFISDWLHYTNDIIAIDSRNKVNTFLIQTGLTKRTRRDYEIKLNITDSYNYVNSVNYDNTVTRNKLDATLSVEKKYFSSLGLLFILRQQLSNLELLIPAPAIGFEYLLLKEKQHYIKGNIGTSVHLPSLNDLYWHPGGNPQLENEKGFNFDIAYERTDYTGRNAKINTEISFFFSRMWDMIKWQPGDYSIWTPVNIDDVASGGMELSFNANKAFGSHNLKIDTEYSYTRVTRISNLNNNLFDGNQLIYIPLNQATTVLKYMNNKFWIKWNMSYTGLRFLTNDNSESLPDYILNSATAGYEMRLKSCKLSFSFDISNILNQSYQTIVWYPMPGRTYSVSMFIKLIANNEK